MRFIPTWLHGIADYLMGIVLISAPWALNFAGANAEAGPITGAETWVPVFLGFGIIIYSLFTRYELGLFPGISMKTHLTLDAVSAVFLAASPWLFGFSEFVYLPHVILGVMEFCAAIFTETVPSEESIEAIEPGVTTFERRGSASRTRPFEQPGGMGSAPTDVSRPTQEIDRDNIPPL